MYTVKCKLPEGFWKVYLVGTPERAVALADKLQKLCKMVPVLGYVKELPKPN